MNQQEKLRVLVVGSLNMDLVLRAKRVPTPGESLLGETYDYIPGGKGGNQAVAAARLGEIVTFCGCVGKDAHGELLAASLRDEGINTDHLLATEAAPSGLAVVILESTGQNRIIVYGGANLLISEDQVKTAFRGGRYDGILLNLEIPEAVVEATIAEAGRHGLPVILDAGPAKSVDLTKLRGLEIITPNETETEALTGIDCGSWEEAENAARLLRRETKARYVVIKMGARGALLAGREGVHRFPAFRVDPLDTTAAGDAFTSALTVEYLERRNIAAAMRVALAAGAIAVTRFGAQPSLPTRREVEEFLAASGRHRGKMKNG
jgi:ribokinase